MEKINGDPQYIHELIKEIKDLKKIVFGLFILLAMSTIAIYTATDLLLKVIK